MRRAVMLSVVLVLSAVAGYAAGDAYTVDRRVPLVRYHDPSAGWTTRVPAGWESAALGPQFVRGSSPDDATALVFWTYRDRSPAQAVREFTVLGGIATPVATGTRITPALRWQRFRSRARGDPAIGVDLAVAKRGADVYVAALVARRDETARLLRAVLLPALDGFRTGRPDRSESVLAGAPPEPAYWPTHGWRRATPQSRGIDGRRFAALVAVIRAQRLPIDSVTVVRNGYIVLDVSFPPFAAGRLGEPYASDHLHELHSATKSVTSAVVGIALHDSGGRPTVTTPVVRFFPSYRPARTDARKRAMTLRDLLTMQTGLAWKEWGAAYEQGTGNDLVTMIETAGNWTHYVLDRPMAARPGSTFLYNSGASHVLSAAVSALTGRAVADLAAERLFRPLGIRTYVWPSSPERVTTGWGGLRLRPRDLAKLAFLYLHRGRWDGRQIVPAGWVRRSTTDLVGDPVTEYGYQWWLDRADGYAYMGGRFGQLAIVAPRADLVTVITAHLPEAASVTVPRLLFERYVLAAVAGR